MPPKSSALRPQAENHFPLSITTVSENRSALGTDQRSWQARLCLYSTALAPAGGNHKAVLSRGFAPITARPGALVRKTGADPAQLGNQFLDDAHTAVESRIARWHKRKMLWVRGGNTEIRNLWRIGLASSSPSRLVAPQPAWGADV